LVTLAVLVIILDYPIAWSFLLAFFHGSFAFVRRLPSPWTIFFSRLLNYPLWAVVLLACLFRIISSVQNSYLYRLARTYHQRVRVDEPLVPLYHRSVPIQTFGEVVVPPERDITNVTPITPRPRHGFGA